MTEYEKNFTEQGMAINMVQIVKPAGFEIPVSSDFTLHRAQINENDK